MSTWPPKDLYPERGAFYSKMAELPTSTLVKLFSRTDMELEESLLGGRDTHIVGVVMSELEKRYGNAVMDSLTPEDRQLLLESMRRHVSDERYLGAEPLWLFAARYDGEYVVRLLEENPKWLKYSLDRSIRCLVLAGDSERAWNLLKRQVPGMHEFQLCGLIGHLGDNKMAIASDFIFKKTRDRRWLVRLSALYALDRLDDPRTDAALESSLGDIKRSETGGLFDRVSRKMLSEAFRQELATAIEARRIPGAAGTLEKMVNNRSEGKSTARISAGWALLRLDPQQGCAAISKLLSASNVVEQEVGIEMAKGIWIDEGVPEEHARVVIRELERLKDESPHENVREHSQQVLEQILDHLDD